MPQHVTVGRDAKEDLVVELTHTPGEQNSFAISSSVESLFGEQITAMVHRTVEALGLREVAVTVKDQGALDWVIQARLEAAARQLGQGPVTPVLPPLDPGSDLEIERDRMRRSRLYLPGNQPDLMINAGLFTPDAIILDLEDAVAPAQKPAAQILVRNALRTVDFMGLERMVRINPLPLGNADLEIIVPEPVHTLLIPKAEHASDIHQVVDKIKTLTDREIFLMPILESAMGIEHALEIAAAHPWVVALAFGAEDFTKDIGAARTQEGTESFVARSKLVLAARAARVQPIDTVYSDVANEAGLMASTREAIALGFDGKGCIHPRQVEVIHRAFRPADKDVTYALKVKAAMALAEQRGDGVISIGSKMIDPPVVARALRVIKLATFYQMDLEQMAEVSR